MKSREGWSARCDFIPCEIWRGTCRVSRWAWRWSPRAYRLFWSWFSFHYQWVCDAPARHQSLIQQLHPEAFATKVERYEGCATARCECGKYCSATCWCKRITRREILFPIFHRKYGPSDSCVTNRRAHGPKKSRCVIYRKIPHVGGFGIISAKYSNIREIPSKNWRAYGNSRVITRLHFFSKKNPFCCATRYEQHLRASTRHPHYVLRPAWHFLRCVLIYLSL